MVYCLEDMLATPTGSSSACYMELTPHLIAPSITHAHTRTHAEEVPDSFFNVTVQDVKNMQDDLKRQV